MINFRTAIKRTIKTEVEIIVGIKPESWITKTTPFEITVTALKRASIVLKKKEIRASKSADFSEWAYWTFQRYVV